MTKVLIADDHQIVLDGVESVLRGTDFEVVARCTSGDQVIELLETTAPDIAILDVRMPGGASGLDVLRWIRRNKHPTKVILLTVSLEDDEALEAISLGVNGLVLKEAASSQLLDAVHQARRGGQWIDPEVMARTLRIGLGRSPSRLAGNLTPRELEILRLVKRGLRNREIAAEVSIAEGTVKMHLHSIYHKLGVGNRTELVIFAQRHSIG
jgi:DNA-binding NarL/FixJ family response regulator